MHSMMPTEMIGRAESHLGELHSVRRKACSRGADGDGVDGWLGRLGNAHADAQANDDRLWSSNLGIAADIDCIGVICHLLHLQ
jgi:hypothetical protein